MDQVIFKLLTAHMSDLNALHRLEHECFERDAWPLLDLVGVLTIPGVVRIKAVINDEMIGFIAGEIDRTHQLGWVTTVGVRPQFRGQGIGTALLLACEESMNMPCVRLCVRRSNQSALRMYARNGYLQVDRWHAYYQDGEDAFVLEKCR
jgi:ribosomal-protein-alanine N-acetyltransferase